MSELLKRLLSRFLTLPVVEGEPDPDPADASPPDDDGTLGDLLDTDVDPPDPDADPAEELKRVRKEAEDAQRELAAERAARRAESATRAPAPTPTTDADYEREERELKEAQAAGKDVSLLQWQIGANRTLRATKQNADAALREAQDIADRTSFERLEVTKPGLFKRYKERVEDEITKMRARGQNAPRLGVLQFLIGKDALDGTLKPAKKKEPAAAPTGVDRGRTPGVRTDVTGRTRGLSEHEKRRARLGDQPI